MSGVGSVCQCANLLSAGWTDGAELAAACGLEGAADGVCLRHSPCALGPVLAQSMLGVPSRMRRLRGRLDVLALEIGRLATSVRRTERTVAGVCGPTGEGRDRPARAARAAGR